MSKGDFDWLTRVKPNIIIASGFIVLIFIGIMGSYFSWRSLSRKPIVMLTGALLFTIGYVLHIYCHRYHAKAHETSDKILVVIDTGPFAVVRHPMYVGLIAMYIGMSIAWGILLMFIPVILYSVLIVMISIEEEKYLMKTLETQYKEYMVKVPWRYIPGIF
jgi:protein-S-isoprenylcysteine O-methyltransferase Ste14